LSTKIFVIWTREGRKSYDTIWKPGAWNVGDIGFIMICRIFDPVITTQGFSMPVSIIIQSGRFAASNPSADETKSPQALFNHNGEERMVKAKKDVSIQIPRMGKHIAG